MTTIGVFILQNLGTIQIQRKKRMEEERGSEEGKKKGKMEGRREGRREGRNQAKSFPAQPNSSYTSLTLTTALFF